MGVGFIITILLLSLLLGMFARQTLAAAGELETDAQFGVEDLEADPDESESASDHFHAV